jgi:hypothetical protein
MPYPCLNGELGDNERHYNARKGGAEDADRGKKKKEGPQEPLNINQLPKGSRAMDVV